MRNNYFCNYGFRLLRFLSCDSINLRMDLREAILMAMGTFDKAKPQLK